ncbi:hypothetical protein, partial [Klebsiella pneumoniae]|uniref:hypothetical protein n=1 Tax=Klebsiella pneumoniae TaxID=573 RepID=UPI0019396FE8
SRYSNLEKHVLAVVVTSRRLKPYFQSHTIHVLTNAPIRRILHKPDASGRLLKWTIELSEFHIEYIPRKAIKAQILADFLQECTFPTSDPPEPPEAHDDVLAIGECWNLYSYGSSAKDHKGAGFVLKSPEGIKFIYALKYQ